MHAVAERRDVGHHRQHRQTHLQREVTAGQQDGATALALDEAQPRRSLARENFESLMPLARITSVSAVAAMSPKPMMASNVRSS